MTSMPRFTIDITPKRGWIFVKGYRWEVWDNLPIVYPRVGSGWNRTEEKALKRAKEQAEWERGKDDRWLKRNEKPRAVSEDVRRVDII